MRKLFIILIVSIMSLFFSLSCFADVNLSPEEIEQIEARIRKDFKLQNAHVNSSLLGIGQKLDKFLFGPDIRSKLSVFFNKRIKPGKITDQEKLWELFKKEVLSKERFDAFIDEMIEVHFRVFDKSRREINRDLMMYGLDGVEKMSYEDIKKKLKQEIDKIWNIQAAKMKEILSETGQSAGGATSIHSTDLYVGIAASALEVAAIIPSPFTPVLIGAGVAIYGGWNIYKYAFGQSSAERQMETAQQQFMRKMEKQLQILSEKTKEQFKIASDAATRRLFDAIRKMVVDKYPQIRMENLK